MRPATLPVSAWLRVLSFDSGPLPLRFVITCRELQAGCFSAGALPRLSIARKWLAAAVRALSGMLLSPAEVGPLPDLVDELKRVEIDRGRKEDQLRASLACGMLPTEHNLGTADFDAVFLHLMLLLTDMRRCPSTAAPYAAAVHLRQLTCVAGPVGEELLRSLAASRATVPRHELLRARREVISALPTLGELEAPHIVQCFRALQEEECSVRIAVLEALPLLATQASRLSPSAVDVARVVADDSEDVRRAAMELFERMAGPSADIVRVLALELRSANTVFALAAVRALEHLGQASPRVIPEIALQLGHIRGDRKVHMAAVRALTKLRPVSAEAVVSLTKMLDDGLDVESHRSVSDALRILQQPIT